MAKTFIGVNFRDLTGQQAIERFCANGLVPAGGQAALVAALDGISDAAITGMTLTASDDTEVGVAAAGVYTSAEDKAIFYFRSSGGNYQIAVPCPDEAIFLPDKETVDPTAAAAFITAIEANSTDPNGNALTFVSGRRIKTSAKSY